LADGLLVQAVKEDSNTAKLKKAAG